MRKRLFIVIALLAVAAALAGYFMWNKPHLDVKKADAIPVAATALYQAFVQDSTAARSKYQQQVLLVSGTVKTVAANQQQQMIVMLNSGTDGASVNCTLEEKAEGIRVNDKVTIRGICSGMGQADEDLGIPADLYLLRAYLEK